MARAKHVALDGYCHVFDVTTAVNDLTGTKINVTAHEDDVCDTFIGQGFIGKVGTTKGAAISGVFGGSAATVWTLVFQYPLATGGLWAGYTTTDGVHMTLTAQGTYTLVTATDSRKGQKSLSRARH
jgi:hypothetical protein